MLQVLRMVSGPALVAGLLAVTGCGGAGRVNRPHDVAPASGVVMLNGQPVEGASVTFHPAGATGAPGGGGKPAARGKTDAQGRFRLWTFDLDDGAVPGEHAVTINKVEIIASDVDPDAEGYDSSTAAPEPPPRYIVPEKYGNQRTSGLTATVNPDGANEFIFELEG